tara:strand:- start:536 stop:697 length:162 start_codon:yes stop_codon:yes gene_type:complete
MANRAAEIGELSVLLLAKLKNLEVFVKGNKFSASTNALFALYSVRDCFLFIFW